MISASKRDLRSASEMTPISPSNDGTPPLPSPLLHSAPPSVCGQISRLQGLDKGHLTNNSIIHKTRVTMCIQGLPQVAMFSKGRPN